MHLTPVSTKTADITPSLEREAVRLDLPPVGSWRLTSRDGRLPVVWHTRYDFPLPVELAEPRHLNPAKRAQISRGISQVIDGVLEFAEPPSIERDPLDLYDGIRKVHGRDYLHSLYHNPDLVSHAMQIPRKEIVKFPFDARSYTFIEPALYATVGTILTAKLALETGWGLNTSGGFHHAGRNTPEGFCLLADIPIALSTLRMRSSNLKALVIDLDAHHGNGTLELLGTDPDVVLFDIFNRDVYPCNRTGIPSGNFLFGVDGSISDREYLSLVEDNMPRAIQQAQPDIIFYNAGYDVWDQDPIGHMKLSREAILERDLLVLTQAKRLGIPIAMVVSGGYNREVATLVTDTFRMIRNTLIDN